MLVADLVALSWVGMWGALVARSHNLATVSTLVRVLVLPWLLFGAVVGVGQFWYGWRWARSGRPVGSFSWSCGWGLGSPRNWSLG